MTQDEFSDIIDEEIKKLGVLPPAVEASAAGGAKWIFEQIRRANGLAIYPHPTWITGDAYHVPDAIHKYFVENKLFDAFEVLGGELYYEQNGFQTVQYYQDKANGYDYPIVGSTDTHGSYPTNPAAYICSTIVFSDKNERCALINAIRQHMSVAVDTISKEFRLVGDLRLVRYGCFLIKNYFPIHDAACLEQGRMMRQYAIGDDTEKQMALKTLEAMNGRIEHTRRKYFAF